MAGYVRKRTVYKLKFADEEFDGLEVLVKSMDLGEYRTFVAEMVELAGEDGQVDVDDLGADELELLDRMYEKFAGVLLKWNLQRHEDPFDESTPVVDVPPTLEGLQSQEPGFVMQIIDAWMTATSDIDVPLGARSSDGRPSEELASMMEPLSASQAS